MTTNRLAVTEFVKVFGNAYGDVYRPSQTASKPARAFLYAHGVNPNNSLAMALLPDDKPDMAFLAPDGYDLFAAKGQLSDYDQSERFDVCKPGVAYVNYRMEPIEDLSFVDMDGDSFNALAEEPNFDVIILRKTSDLRELVEASSLFEGYEQLDLHCGRCSESDPVSPKYFLPMNTSAYLIQKSEPIGWHQF